MAADKIGFGSSWSMLTRDKGWQKPVLVLALVAWIPIAGQVALMGYACEWARLTAWGVDAAPKQQGVDIDKVLYSGVRAYGVVMLMSIVLSFLNAVVPLFGFVGLIPFGMYGVLGAFVVAGYSTALGLLSGIVSFVAASFMNACALRAVIYDRFSAGWRVDRVGQMVLADLKGFLRVLVVSLLASLIPSLACGAVAVAGGIMFAAGFVAVSVGAVAASATLEAVLAWGLVPALLFGLFCVLVAYVLSTISVAMTFVSVNAVGQWFNRFEVRRWGESSAPLPDGVPVQPAPHGAPTQPVD